MAEEHIWVISNRADDRVVLWERDAIHHGGEAFVGGPVPALVGRSGEVERLLREGQLLEIPEPPDSNKKPRLELIAAVEEPMPAMPGQEVRLGRALDPEIVPESAMRRLERKQEELPDSIAVPSGVVVPPEPEPERSTRRR